MNDTKIIALSILSGFYYSASSQQSTNLPNIIVILTDDLGYGDLSCFGAPKIKTPYLDRMAEEGIRFSEFYCASPISSPSRAGLLTGRLPQRMGINAVFFPDSHTGMPSNEITIAEMLKTKGYKTGIVGKWHLGHLEQFLPLQQGFDSYFGIPYSNDMTSIVYYRNNEVEEFNVDQQYITQRYTQESLKFIKESKEMPFFLYVAHNMPHVPIYASPEFKGKSDQGVYGDVIQEIDWSVGQIYKTLDSLKILDNTLIIFTSDNGPWLPFFEQAGSAGGLREGKQTTFEGGMRVPCVAMWRNTVKPQSEYNDISSTLDLFPTIAEIVNYTLPDSIPLDGVSILNILKGNGNRTKDNYIYFNRSKPNAFRDGDWKIILPYKGNEASRYSTPIAAHDTLLFNLKSDPGEKNNLVNIHPEKVKYLVKKMNEELQRIGTLPPSLIINSSADKTHYDIQKKNHPEYFELINK